MSKPENAAIAIGKQVAALLGGGKRTATYKLATLYALINFCVDMGSTDPRGSVDVPIDALAHRVMELYWRQVAPLEGADPLSQSSQTALILTAVRQLRLAVDPDTKGGVSLAVAKRRRPDEYEVALAALIRQQRDIAVDIQVIDDAGGTGPSGRGRRTTAIAVTPNESWDESQI
jgi:hypothetical protein